MVNDVLNPDKLTDELPMRGSETVNKEELNEDEHFCTSAGNPVDRAKCEPSQEWCDTWSHPVVDPPDYDERDKQEPQHYDNVHLDDSVDAADPISENKKKTRRGKKRKHLGSNERRWQKLEEAEQWQ